MFSETDRAYIRHFLGYGAIFLQAEPRLENAVTATQSTADGGARPDSTTENWIRATIYGSTGVAGTLPVINGTQQSAGGSTAFPVPSTVGLLAIETQLSQLWTIAFVTKADNEADVDPFRAMVHLRAEGRRLANSLARMLGMRGVRADVFSPGTPIKDDDPWTSTQEGPFVYGDYQAWRRGP